MSIQKIRQFFHRMAHHAWLWEHDDSETQILVPVEAPAGNHQNTLFMQQAHSKILSILKIKFLLIQCREQIKCCPIGYKYNPRLNKQFNFLNHLRTQIL